MFSLEIELKVFTSCEDVSILSLGATSKDVFSSYVKVTTSVLESSHVLTVSVAFIDDSVALATLIDSSAIIQYYKNKNLIFKHNHHFPKKIFFLGSVH